MSVLFQFLRVLWWAYCLPGMVVIWSSYYFPTEWGKKRNVAESARQWRNRSFFAPFYTTLMILMIFLLATPSEATTTAAAEGFTSFLNLKSSI